MNFKLKLLRHLLKDNTQGLTIIEGLLAIVIVTLLIVAIGPVLAFAAATRIQARRVELASQAATAYLDSVRTGSSVAPPVALVGPLPQVPDTNLPDFAKALADVEVADSGSLVCNANQYCTEPKQTSKFAVYCADRTGNAQCSTTLEDRKDFVIQAMGVQRDLGNTADPKRGYLLAIRVYRADSFGAGLTLLKKSDNKPGSKGSVLAGGSGNRVAPVVEFTTEIPPS